ncbi:Nucleoporin SEH1 (GATOR complex protein SEH1) (Nup107-160 subcomplex subunit seh1), partial [Durusdinium trenchii]
MKQVKTFAGGHDDFVHDVAYDHNGKRLATCSSDHAIKVWSEDGSGMWRCDAELKGHVSAVWKLAWAHPEFGQVIASCSFDQHIHIWEELDTPVSKMQTGGKAAAGANGSNGSAAAGDAPGGNVDVLSTWNQSTVLKGDNRESVNDMQFAPRHFGLQLATCSTDGIVRIFAPDDVMNLSLWTMGEKFDATRGLSKTEATSLSWNQSRFDQQMIVVGTTSQVVVWTKNEDLRRWEVLADLPMHSERAINDVCWAPNLGRSYHLIAAAASNSESVEIWKLSKNHETNAFSAVEHDATLTSRSEVWRCEWNVTGTVLATSGDDGHIRLWRKSFNNEWGMIAEEGIG